MARGKFKDKKHGTSGATGEVKKRVGSPSGATSLALPAPTGADASPTSGRAGRPAELPALGVAIMSPWGWRILAVFAMVAFGLCLTFFLDGKTVFAILWLVVTLSWSGFSVKVWRDHLAWDRGMADGQ
jgi:hypothetical protein